MIINLAKIRFGGSGGGTSPAKPEDSFQETYTANGNYDVAPQAGHVFSGGTITVNVQPKLQTKEATPLTLAQTVSPDAGYDGLQSVTVTGVTSEIDSNITADNIKKDVTILGVTGTLESGITPEGTITITANGTYDVSSKATADVQVGGTDYRYKTGTPDTIGLAAIGWTADDIGYYSANTPHYAWQNDNYKVSQKNIDLYSLDDPQPSLYRNDPDVTFVPNKNILKYFGPGSGNTGFYSMKYIKSIPLFNTSTITSLYYWFSNCTSLQTIPLLDTSEVTNMGYMFQNCNSLQTIPQLNTSNVTDMSDMFYGCSSLETIPLLDTSKVTTMKEMFFNCYKLTSIPQLNTSNVTDMYQMFCGCSSLETIPLLDTSKVTDMQNLFRGCSKLTSIPLLDTSNVKSMYDMFDGCSSLTSIPQLNTSKVTDMSYMFESCSSLTSIPPLDTSNVKSMSRMFGGCSSLTSIPPLDTSNVNNMDYMFYDCPSLQNVNGIDFSSFTSYPNTFFGYNFLDRLTHFIVNGKINFSWDEYYGFNVTPYLDYDSIKSILEAMNRTDNTDAKTMMFNQVIADQNGELAGLVSSCATKGWTIQGLTIKEQSMINSITPNIDHITKSNFNGEAATNKLSLTIDANESWTAAGRPQSRGASTLGLDFDYYDATTDEMLRTGYHSDYDAFTVTSGSIGETITEVRVPPSSASRPDPKSGEYALVGISFKSVSTPYEYIDYYLKVYPDGE